MKLSYDDYRRIPFSSLKEFDYSTDNLEELNLENIKLIEEISSFNRYITSHFNPSRDGIDSDEVLNTFIPIGLSNVKLGRTGERASGDAIQKLGLSKKFRTIHGYISDEIYLALCTNDKRYLKETKLMTKNFKPLVIAVSGYVASEIGIAVTVISAITASILWLTLHIGKNAFCNYYTDKKDNKRQKIEG